MFPYSCTKGQGEESGCQEIEQESEASVSFLCTVDYNSYMDADESNDTVDGNPDMTFGSRKRYLGSSWFYMPEALLMNVFQYLSARELMNVGITCSTWYSASVNELLWRDLLYKDFKIDRSIGIMPGEHSWRAEYKRLTYHTPIVQTDVLHEHTDQVLHVSFAHNGEMFATCSKDGSVVVWNSGRPVTIKYQRDMKCFSWKYTKFSQFNQSDTLLLVSGVHFGTPHSTSGEIAVFSLADGLELQCRVLNKPYDIFGAWYSDQHLVSGDLKELAHLVSQSVLWLNKASQETASEHIPITNQMFRFYNFNASSIRAVMVANCLVSEPGNSDCESDLANLPCCSSSSEKSANVEQRKSNPPSHRTALFNINSKILGFCGGPNSPRSNREQQGSKLDMEYASPIEYNAEYRQVETENVENSVLGLGDDTWSSDKCADDMSEVSEMSEVSADGDDWHSEEDELCVREDRFLIFTMGSETYTPHQIGIKRIKPFSFPRRMDPGLSLRERIANRARERQRAKDQPNNYGHANLENLEYDKVDHLIDLHGHIIGMGLSPDHRYLYVNTRPWPHGYVLVNPLMPPPIAQEIDIHVIDLVTMKEVGMMLRSHKAYTPNHECFFIFLDVCKEYVASGAEDKHGYLWDRHYGTCLAKFPHQDVVNSVVFNPQDSEMLITVSDDHTIKVWHSRCRAKDMGLDPTKLPRGREVHRQTNWCHKSTNT